MGFNLLLFHSRRDNKSTRFAEVSELADEQD